MPTPRRFDTLISAGELLALQQNPGTSLAVFDCSFDLANTEAGRAGFAQAHIPGSQYLHLDEDLSGPKVDANGRFQGRHPLPDFAELARRAGQWGITPGTQVVAYDQQGSPYAARLWWLLRWLGHDAVAVLDGGLSAWQVAGGAVESGNDQAPAAATPYPATGASAPTINADALLSQLGRALVVDARAAERYRGDVEPLDKAAGHIPGARNRFFKDNLAPNGQFKSPDVLKTEWAALLHSAGGGEALVHQCGSGVTACHNLLAVAVAGGGLGRLYPGSWSEWSSDPSRPIAQGA